MTGMVGTGLKWSAWLPYLHIELIRVLVIAYGIKLEWSHDFHEVLYIRMTPDSHKPQPTVLHEVKLELFTPRGYHQVN